MSQAWLAGHVPNPRSLKFQALPYDEIKNLNYGKTYGIDRGFVKA